MRPILIICHRWLGLGAGLLLVVLGLTGALYAFEPQIRAVVGEALAGPEAGPARHPAALEARLRAQGWAGQGQWYLWPLQDDLPVWVRWEGADGEALSLMVDPRTGDYLPRATAVHGVMQGLLVIHRTLGAGELGRWITGVATLVLLGLVVSGMAVSVRRWRHWGRIWIPGRREREHGAPSIRRRRHHRLVGAWAAPGLVLLAVTGLTWSFGWTADLVRWMGGTTANVPAGEGALREVTTTGAIAWERIWERTAEARESAGEFRFMPPGETRQAVRFEWSPPDAPFTSFRSQRLLDPGTGAVLAERSWHAMAAGDRALRWAYPLHTGRVAGWPGQLLAALFALTLPYLLWSGVGHWLLRRRPADPAPTKDPFP